MILMELQLQSSSSGQSLSLLPPMIKSRFSFSHFHLSFHPPLQSQNSAGLLLFNHLISKTLAKLSSIAPHLLSIASSWFYSLEYFFSLPLPIASPYISTWTNYRISYDVNWQAHAWSSTSSSGELISAYLLMGGCLKWQTQSSRSLICSSSRFGSPEVPVSFSESTVFYSFYQSVVTWSEFWDHSLRGWCLWMSWVLLAVLTLTVFIMSQPSMAGWMMSWHTHLYLRGLTSKSLFSTIA